MQGKQRSTMPDYLYVFQLVVSLRNLEFFYVTRQNSSRI